jgi:hypothetical protein
MEHQRLLKDTRSLFLVENWWNDSQRLSVYNERRLNVSATQEPDGHRKESQLEHVSKAMVDLAQVHIVACDCE